jgi:hypothetical protein
VCTRVCAACAGERALCLKPVLCCLRTDGCKGAQVSDRGA